MLSQRVADALAAHRERTEARRAARAQFAANRAAGLRARRTARLALLDQLERKDPE